MKGGLLKNSYVEPNNSNDKTCTSNFTRSKLKATNNIHENDLDDSGIFVTTSLKKVIRK
jgi:hypothetical protein